MSELKKQKEYMKKQLSKDIANQKKSVYRMSNEELNNEMDRLNKMKTTLELRRSVEKLSSKKLSDVKKDDKQKGLLNLIISASKVKASEAVSEVLKDKIKDHFKKSPNKYEEAKREAEYWSNVNTAYRNKKEYSKKSPDKYEEAKIDCETVLERYQTLKRKILDDRHTEKGTLPEEIPTNVEDYKGFVDKLLRLCKELQSKDYPRMKVALYSLVGIKLYEKRREHSVLTLDEEMLLFLVAMVTKGERIRMEDLYKRFQKYGIEFSFQTKNAISDYLMKLNLLERKSDSGEAKCLYSAVISLNKGKTKIYRILYVGKKLFLQIKSPFHLLQFDQLQLKKTQPFYLNYYN